MPKKKHWFFTVKGKGGCPPAFATGVDGNLTIPNGSNINLSSITKASSGNVWQFDNLDIQSGGNLWLDIASGIDLVQIICKTSCNIDGGFYSGIGGPIYDHAWENNGSSISGTTVSGYSYSASIVQNSGGAGGGGGAGGAGTNGYGGGGEGGQNGGYGGFNNGAGFGSSAPGGAGDSTQGAGLAGGGASAIADCTLGGASGPGGAGGGSGGGGGRTTSVHHPATHDKITIPAWDECTYGPGGGGGGEKGWHPGYVFIYFCETITGSGGFSFGGGQGSIGGDAGGGGAGCAGGGGGGAGGSGGHIWVECAAHSLAYSIVGGTGKVGGSGAASGLCGNDGASGPNGNDGTFTHIPV